MRAQLGQHFLKRTSILKEIAGALSLNPEDVLIEIGPGHGELTRCILELFPNLTFHTIERDPALTTHLRTAFPTNSFPNLIFHEGDVREDLIPLITTFSKHCEYKIVGNIPYYLTGFLFRMLGDISHKPATSVFTVQKEVAERITASPPKMNLLAAALQIWATPKIITRIPASDFTPPPKVDSAVLLLSTKPDIPPPETLASYFVFVKNLFRQPRKTAINNLSAAYPSAKNSLPVIFSSLSIPLAARPQNLSSDKIFSLSQKF